MPRQFGVGAVNLKTTVGTTDFPDNRIKKGLRCKGCSPGGWPRKRFSTMTKPVPIRVILSPVVSELADSG